jgi:hypothetical protein
MDTDSPEAEPTSTFRPLHGCKLRDIGSRSRCRSSTPPVRASALRVGTELAIAIEAQAEPPEGEDEEDAMAKKKVEDRDLEDVSGGVDATTITFNPPTTYPIPEPPPDHPRPPVESPEPDDVDGGGGPQDIEPQP